MFFPKKLLLKSFLYFLKKSFSNFEETELSYISGKVYSEAQHNLNFLIFQERHIQNPSITELSYISEKEHLKPLDSRIFLIFQERYIQNPGIFRTRTIFRILVYSKPETLIKLMNIYNGAFGRNSPLLSLNSKNKKILPRKFLIFQERELCSSNIKKMFIFSQNKAFLIFWEMESPPKICYFLGKGSLLNFRKQKPSKHFLFFQK